MVEFDPAPASPDQELVAILRTALVCPDESPRIDPTAPRDWGLLVQRAAEERLSVLLQASLRELRWLSFLPENASAQLKRLAFGEAAKGLRFKAAVAELTREFAKEGIPLVLLKGAALGLTIYRDYGERQLRDLDILVPKTMTGAAERVLSRLGFVQMLTLDDQALLDFSCEKAFRRPSPPCVVELHWHLFNLPAEIERVPIEWFWDHTESVSVDGAEAKVLDPEALLLHLVSHLYLHHSGQGILWALDIALLLARQGDRMRWAETAEAANRFGIADPMRLALTDAGNRWGLGQAENWLAYFLAERVRLRKRLAFGIASAPHSEAGILTNVLRLEGFGRKVAYLRNALLPSADYMMSRYRLRHRWELPFCHLQRLVRGLFLLLRSIGSVTANLVRVFRGGR